MKPRRLALLDRSSQQIPLATLSKVAQALQTQLDRDFTPVWGVAATIAAFDHGEKVPSSYWPLRIVDQPVGGLGIHLDRNHHPYAQIMAADDWSITASHEMLEMLVDPYGQKLFSAPDIDPHSDHHQVRYLVEVSDPCEIWSYEIDGVAVSDFVTAEYYNDHADPGVQLDYLGRLSKPLEVPRGCYISWIDPADRRWHQKTPDGTFITAKVEVNPQRNPREDRDRAFGNDPERHDLAAIRLRWRGKGAAPLLAAAMSARGKKRGKKK
jgi:hypothetical protein